jgi:hypothetical protein
MLSVLSLLVVVVLLVVNGLKQLNADSTFLLLAVINFVPRFVFIMTSCIEP